MNRIISAIILLSLLTVNISILTACYPATSAQDQDENENQSSTDTIYIPEYKDYGRDTVNFSSIKYSRPDAEKLIEDFGCACEIIEKNEVDFDTQLKKIVSLEDGYSNFLTMRAYANIRFQADVSDSYWAGEYNYISTSSPIFSKSVENLFVSAANSPHAQRFEDEYFGENLIEDYKDGGMYTDEIVELMTLEAELEAEYSALMHEDINNKSKHLAVELFKVRRKISDLLGYSSYAALAYDSLHHDYSEERFIEFAKDISEYIVPVYFKLCGYIFNQYQISDKKHVGTEKLINDTGKMLKEADAELYEIYSYMLQHSLFDVKVDTPSRFDGSFTTYLDSYNAPFIFMTASEKAPDYTTLCHEFGHFADMYINYSAESALDLSEISSQALELLALTKFDSQLSPKTVDELTVSKMEDALSCLVFQGFYAMFEHIAYLIPYEDISIESLNHAVALAAEEMGLNFSFINDLSYVMIPHVMLYPFYVQSYCTSVTAALEIYFAELDEAGSGFKMYTALLKRSEGNLTFEEELCSAGLSSPFEKGQLKNIADRIHYELLGSHYFTTGGSENAA